MTVEPTGANNRGMVECLPTKQAFQSIAKGIDLEPTDKAVDHIFIALVLSRHTKPFLPGWWKLDRLNN